MRALPFIVALTGGIASGKSAASDRFAELGAEVIDADRIARELVAPGQPALAEIAAAFGPEALDASGALDRRTMRERVFAEPAARRRLEAILHPRVRHALRERAGASTAPYVVLAIPLLTESGGYDWVDRVLVVDTPRETQHRRLVARDDITPELADAMLDAQATRAQRLALADDVVANDGSLSELHARIAELHRRYLAMAARKHA
ncbi:dephospho-CoA kinase [Dokdonella sp.]|uniref:dephospho-CoA kinase n=1 Tax=Dokdonella sp. TaxID=2291710 RepID=UPI001B1902CB|nr:dephospho-CoA kinase [Dokdonella sp.]MBO9665053.1 dephospho-CoA kinase [Dokdonella sp.]